MFNQSNFGRPFEIGECRKNIKGNGYTLIEILIALTLLIVLLMFSSQSYQHIKAAIESRVVLSRLITLIHYARSEAIRIGRKVIICKSKDGFTCSGSWSDGQLVFTNEQKPHVLLAFGAVKEGALSFQAFQSSDFLRFMPSGATFEQNGSFIYRLNHANKPVWILIVEKSGRIRVV